MALTTAYRGRERMSGSKLRGGERPPDDGISRGSMLLTNSRRRLRAKRFAIKQDEEELRRLEGTVRGRSGQGAIRKRALQVSVQTGRDKLRRQSHELEGVIERFNQRCCDMGMKEMRVKI